MGLNPRGRGRGGPGKGRRGGGMGGQGPMFRGPPGMYGPPSMGFPAGPSFGTPFFGGPCGSNFGPRRPPGFGKFPRKNFKMKGYHRNDNTPIPEIDLTRPWVTDEIKSEEAKKQELLEAWRKSKDDSDWNKYKEQKQIVHTLYEKGRTEYLAGKPEEAAAWLSARPAKTRRYHCDACDKTFPEEDSLILHEAEHETCGRDGCPYTAHPKLVAKHVKMQHDTGLYKRMGKLYSDEDVTKWIEERKRKYPTRKVVEEKKALELEKEKRGERIKDKNDSLKAFRKRGEKSRKMKSFERKSLKVRRCLTREKRMRTMGKDREMTVSEALKEESSSRGTIPPFSGIGALYSPEELRSESKHDSDFSDDEWDVNKVDGDGGDDAQKDDTMVTMNNVLAALASSYDSDASMNDEEATGGNDSAPEEVKTVHVKEEEEVKTVTGDKRLREGGGRSNRKCGRVKQGKETKPRCIQKKREPTLLEKLLSKEIRHERNVILQCIRYVMKNNFFVDS